MKTVQASPRSLYNVPSEVEKGIEGRRRTIKIQACLEDTRGASLHHVETNEHSLGPCLRLEGTREEREWTTVTMTPSALYWQE